MGNILFLIFILLFVIGIVVRIKGVVNKSRVYLEKLKKVGRESSSKQEDLFIWTISLMLVPKIISNNIFYIFSLTVVVGMFVLPDLFIDNQLYSVIAVVSLWYLFYKPIVFLSSREKKMDFYLGIITVVVLFYFMEILFVQGVLSFVETNVVRFKVIVFIAAILFIAFFQFVKKIMERTKKDWMILIIALIAYTYPLLNMLFLFGVYNLTHPEVFPVGTNTSGHPMILGTFNDSPNTLDFLKIIHFGAQNVYQLPGLSQVSTGIPITQYLMGTLVILVTVGFFVSYATTIISEIRNNNGRAMSEI